MKKVLATLLALSLPAVVLADDNRGFYVQGELGYARVKIHSDEDAQSAKGFSPRLSAGYDLVISVWLQTTPTIRVRAVTKMMVPAAEKIGNTNSTASAYPLFMISI